ncbi:hypothetical protein [Luteimonas marina]|uniref:hypothetical protein n=1 Tax=Luteimonas marina TaxID=488485 RepID=UPI001864AE11|nr:hypothetical protein [Luteimonas marina]
MALRINTSCAKTLNDANPANSIVIPAKAGIHFDFDAFANGLDHKSQMDPSFRWDDGCEGGCACE